MSRPTGRLTGRGVRMVALLFVSLLAILPLAGSAYSNPNAPRTVPSGPKPLLIIMDLSSSMTNDDGSGTVKLDGAKQSMIDLVSRQPPGAEMGLWTYPGTGDSCSAGGYVPGAELRNVDDPAAMAASIRELQANGDTPTGDALKAAVESLKAQGKSAATIVLVSDGESNCNNNPCETARGLAADGYDITVEAVGFQISSEGAEELRCIADATQGSYYDAENSEDLGQRLSALSVPAIKVDVTAPTVAASGGQVQVTARVSNPSARAVPNVWVGLQFNASEDKGSIAPAVIPPRFRLGALNPGQSQERTWLMSTGPAGKSATMNWSVSAWGDTTLPELRRGEIRVTDKLDPTLGGPLLKQILASPKSAIIMGDSYSSGEGTESYLPASDTHAAACHRSDKQYASQLLAKAANPKVRNIACSGAVMVGMTSAQYNRDTRLVRSGQLGLLDEESAPSAVFLTLGGNDIGFSQIAQVCLSGRDCSTYQPLREIVEEGFRSLDDLSRYYQEIYRIANTDDKRADRGNATAPVIVSPYPLALPPTSRATCTEFGRNEIAYINQVQQRLNATIAREVAEAAKAGAEVYFAGDVARMAQPNHTLCDKEPYINRGDLAAATGRTAVDWTAGGGQTRTSVSELLHPNVAGHGAEAAALVSWSTTVALDKPYKEFEREFQVVDDAGKPDQSVDVTEGKAGRTLETAIGNFFRAQIQSTMCPAGTCWLLGTRRSEPRVVGSHLVKAGDSVDFVVPPGTRPGNHQLVLRAVQSDGSVRTATVDLRVKKPLPWWFWGTTGIAALALLTTIGAFWRARRLR